MATVPLRIDGKKYKVKPISELTVSEVIDLDEKYGEKLDHLKYIEWATGLKNDQVFFASISKQAMQAIGSFTKLDKLPVQEKYLQYSIDTVGQRYQIESCGKKGYDLVVFCLAVAMARSNNIDDVHKIMADLYDTKYTEVLPAGIFFLKTSQIGSTSVQSYFQRIVMCLKIKLTGMLRGKRG